MVQAEQGAGVFLRSSLIALLPQLRRFAVVLTGSAEEGNATLGVVCGQLIDDGVGPPDDLPFDRWAVGHIYAYWIGRRRQRRQPISDLRADESPIRAALAEWGPDRLEAEEIARFLAGLPPQQRAAVLLVYGEGYAYEEAAQVLDVTARTVAERVAHVVGALVDRLDLMGGGRARVAADVEPLWPQQEQARE